MLFLSCKLTVILLCWILQSLDHVRVLALAKVQSFQVSLPIQISLIMLLMNVMPREVDHHTLKSLTFLTRVKFLLYEFFVPILALLKIVSDLIRPKIRWFEPARIAVVDVALVVAPVVLPVLHNAQLLVQFLVLVLVARLDVDLVVADVAIVHPNIHPRSTATVTVEFALVTTLYCEMYLIRTENTRI